MKRSNLGRKGRPLLKAKGYFYGKSVLVTTDFSVDGAYDQLVAYRSEAVNTPTKMLISMYPDQMKLKKRLKSGAVSPYETYPLRAIERYFSFAIDPRLLILGIRNEVQDFYALFAFHSSETIDSICDIIDTAKAERDGQQEFLLSNMAVQAGEESDKNSLERLQRKIVLPTAREIDSKRLKKSNIAKRSSSDITTEMDSLETLQEDTYLDEKSRKASLKALSASDYATDTDESSYGLNTTGTIQKSFLNETEAAPLGATAAVETTDCAAQVALDPDNPLPVFVEAQVHIDSGCILRKVGGKVRTSVEEGRVVVRPSEGHVTQAEASGGRHDFGAGMNIDIHVPDIFDSRARNNPQIEKYLFNGGDEWEEELTYIHSDPKAGAHPCSEGSLYMYVAHPAKKKK